MAAGRERGTLALDKPILTGQYALVAAFPIRTEAADNLRDAWSTIAQPWFLGLAAIEGLVLVLCAATHQELAMKVVAVVGLTILPSALRLGAASRR